MKTSIRSAALVLFALLALPARAEDQFNFDPFESGNYRPDRSMWAFNWEVAKPMGDFSKYVDRTSLTGLSIESRSMVGRNYSAGISFSYNRFDQVDPSAQVSSGTSTITGPLYKYADTFGLRLLGHYYFLEGGVVQPYVGGGVGGAWAYGLQQTADLSKTKSSFNFIISPEVGATILLARGATNVGLNLAVRYSYWTAHYGTTGDAQSFSGIAGLIWSY
jgi:outer membrane protein W